MTYPTTGYVRPISEEAKVKNLHLSLTGLVRDYPENKYWAFRLEAFYELHPEFAECVCEHNVFCPKCFDEWDVGVSRALDNYLCEMEEIYLQQTDYIGLQ